MTVLTDERPAPQPADPGGRRRRVPPFAAAAAGAVVLLSVVRVVAAEPNLTSRGTVGAAVAVGVPIGLAGLGGLWSERAGVVNIGLEGMLVLGTWFGAFVGYQHGPWLGVLAGVAGGAAGGLVHAVACVSFGVDQIVSGVAVNILAVGVTRYLSALFFAEVEGGGVTQSPPLREPIGVVSVPGVGPPLARLEERGWFLLSDLAGLAGGLTVGVSLLTVLAVALVPLSYLVLWRTPFGLRLRACGERPVAAESLGVDVYRMKYAAVVVSGASAGLGGAFLVTVASSFYREGQTAGRGFIGLAAMIFGNWRPGGLAAGAGLFGYVDGLQLRSDAAVHALLLALGLVLAGIAAHLAGRRRPVAAAVAAVAGAGSIVLYLTTGSLPQQLVFSAPHITTLLVLSLASQRLRPPAADGQRYRRGEGS